MTRFIAAEPIHPGEYIQDELNARNWAQDDLATVLGISLRQVANLIAGNSGITPEVAHSLAQAFEQNPETWMNLQVSYELTLAAKQDRAVEKRAAVFNKVPVRNMVRRGWIKEEDDPDQLCQAVCRFLRIKSIRDEPQYRFAAKKSTPYASDTGAQKAWYFRAVQLAECLTVPKRYDEAAFADLIQKLKRLTANRQDARGVPRVLAEHGIRLVIVEHLPKTKIDGATFWINGEPVIALSLRYDRIDNFWFTLMHELDHVKNREDGIDVDLMGSEESELPDNEKRANAEAANRLIPKEKLDLFIARVRPLFYQSRVVQFAATMGVHPGIVVGQLQRRKELTYSQLRKLLEKIRDVLVGQTITDGWGDCPRVAGV